MLNYIFSFLLNSNMFYSQINPAYDATKAYMMSKRLSGQDFLVFVIFGIIAFVFIVFLIFVYFKEKKKPRY